MLKGDKGLHALYLLFIYIMACVLRPCDTVKD